VNCKEEAGEKSPASLFIFSERLSARTTADEPLDVLGFFQYCRMRKYVAFPRSDFIGTEAGLVW
jgi:hypothetical protein